MVVLWHNGSTLFSINVNVHYSTSGPVSTGMSERSWVPVLLHHLGIQSNTQAKAAWNPSMGRQKEYWLLFYLVLGTLHKSILSVSQGKKTHKKLPLMLRYHTFSNSRVVYVAKNHYENYRAWKLFNIRLYATLCFNYFRWHRRMFSYGSEFELL